MNLEMQAGQRSGGLASLAGLAGLAGLASLAGLAGLACTGVPVDIGFIYVW